MRIAVAGSGVVGSATGKAFVAHGHEVTFLDVDEGKVAQLRDQGFDAQLMGEMDWHVPDIVTISVPTPTQSGCINMDIVRRATTAIAEGLRGGVEFQTVVVRSTVLPGTTMGMVREILETYSGRKVGDSLGLAMNPEFLRQVSAETDFLNPRLTVIGCAGEREAAVLRELYEPFGAPIYATCPTTAETIKYANNLYNAVKISFFNEFDIACRVIGVDAEFVGSVVVQSAEASWNPDYGTRYLGTPWGGACLPKDTSAFSHFAGELNVPMPLLNGAIQVNRYLGGEAAAPASLLDLVEPELMMAAAD